MKTARIEIVVRTYFESGKYRNNKIVLPISNECATSLDNNNYELCRNCYAQYLALGQQVNFSIFNDKNELMQGLNGINSIDQQDDIW